MTAAPYMVLDMKSRADAAEATAQLAASALRTGLEQNNRASLLLSGGSTPAPAMQILSRADLDWQNVTIGLVDERWVDANHEASNERLVRRELLHGLAAAAQFTPMYTAARTPAKTAEAASKAYAALLPADFILLGMGPDGHVASWFPEAEGLETALDVTAPYVVSVDASNTPVSGIVKDRLTVSLPVIAEARKAVLLMFGDEKRDVFETSLSLPIETRPVRAAVESLGERLTTIWAP